ncbi:MAG: divalent-cation tolerance protein CutA [Candidatus Undinarchaeales archaeon]|nr:divalent-cation tolerance protein CutA [Candidatus Undinarchaeales archaeon]MDP7491663.1 divalent-cation tolerance protein CutA [Candidatus Undinarchaeales archaeon]
MPMYRMLYITAADEKEAEAIAATLVEERLVACVTMLPVRSVYRWEGAVQHDTETVLFAKTRADLVERAMARIVELHSYEVPCVLVLPIEAGHRPYLDWVDEVTE